MTKVEALEREVEKLSGEELAAFRGCFIEYDWQAWDRELERDVADGKLDKLAAEALAQFDRGETREIGAITPRANGAPHLPFGHLLPASGAKGTRCKCASRAS